MHNSALPINYTNPVDYFGGDGGAIDAVRSKVLLAHVFVVDNRARHNQVIKAYDSDIRQINSLILP